MTKRNYILFNQDMLALIKEGKKTMTRRPVKSRDCCYSDGDKLKVFMWDEELDQFRKNRPEHFNTIVDNEKPELEIEVLSVKKESVCDISAGDLLSEGFPPVSGDPDGYLGNACQMQRFFDYWDGIYKGTDFETALCPEVWVVEFKIVEG